MKNRASLVLMEQLVMILVFALAAALCLQAFAGADQISRETARRDQAVVLAQNGAETLKACGGDLEEAAKLLGGVIGEDSLTAQCDEWILNIELLPTEVPGLGQAQVSVMDGGQVLFSLNIGWQEVGG